MVEIDEFVEDIRRRDVLIGGAVVGGLSYVGIVGLSDEQDEVEEELVDLSATLSERDLVDPASAYRTQQEVESALTSARRFLRRDRLDWAIGLAETRHAMRNALSVFPGYSPSPSTPELVRRVTAIENAVEYYNWLLPVFESAASIQTELLHWEEKVLYREGDVGPSDHEIALHSLEDALGNLQRNTEQPDEERITTPIGKVVPSYEAVEADLDDLLNVCVMHQTSQSAYLESSQAINMGSRQWEEDEFEEARNSFRRAHEVVDTVPRSDLSYGVDPLGIILTEYASVFERYGLAIAELLVATDADLTDIERRRQYNSGLQHLLDARAVITES